MTHVVTLDSPSDPGEEPGGDADGATDLATDERRAEDTKAAHHVDQGRLYHYRPALDGLRAIAVIGVIIYHGAQLTTRPLDLLPGGFLGVDLFFVLSGFLITTLLVTEFRKRETIRLGAFWGRRAKRLFPALFLVTALVSIAFLLTEWLHFDATQLSRFPRDGVASLFYVANWNAAFSGLSYFEQFGGASPLRHMWSLAIEEQFYLIWPILVWAGLKHVKLRTHDFARIAFGAACVSAALMALLFEPGKDPSRIYYGTDTRVQAMLIGAFASFVLIDRSLEKLRDTRIQAAGVAGLVGCLLMFRFVHDADEWMYMGGFFLMAGMACVAIATASGPQDTLYTKVLSYKPLVWIGTLSYGLYLWHWPIFVFVDSDRTGLGGIALLLLRIALTLGVSVASYYLVEAPIRFGALADRNQRMPIAVGAAACAALILLGFVYVKPSEADQQLTQAGEAAGAPPGEETRPAPMPNAKAGDLKVLFVGDSSALSLAVRRPKPAGNDPYAYMTDAQLGCSISSDLAAAGKGTEGPSNLCRTEFERWKNDVDAFNPDVTMMLFGPWEIYDRVGKDGKVLASGTPEFADAKLAELERAREILTAKGGKVAMLTAGCLQAPNESWAERSPQINDTWRIDAWNDIVRRFAEQHPQQVKVIDLHGLLCPDGTYTGKINGVPYSDDSIHFNVQGAPIIWDWLEPQLDQFRK